MDPETRYRNQSHTERMRRSLAQTAVKDDPARQMDLVQRSYLMQLVHHIGRRPLIDGMPSVDLFIRMELPDRYRLQVDEQYLRDVEGEMTDEDREAFRHRTLRQFLDRNAAHDGHGDPFAVLDTLTPHAERYLAELTAKSPE